MASYEVRCIYLIGRTDFTVAKTKVRASETTRLLRVVREICLTVLVGIVADNLYRVLVGTYSSVSSQTIELSLEHTFATHRNFINQWKRGKCNIVYDTYREVVLRFGKFKVVEYRNDVSRCGIR